MNAPAPRVIDLDQDGQEISVNLEQMGVSAAEVNQQIATAKKYPRSLEQFRKELIGQVTLSESIARSCIYALPRAGKKIEGPSIRFAEMAMGAWGNCRATARIVAETENFVIAQGIFIDLQRNVAVGIEVGRRIIDSEGRRFNIDMIGVTGAAASSIALRNAILRGIPRALTDEAYVNAKRTVAGTLATLADRRNRALEAFKPYGVTEQQILAALGKQGLVEIGLEDLVTLGGFLTAIQQEERDPEEIFPPATNAATRRQSAPPPAAEKPQQQTSSPSGGGSAGADAPKADGGDGGEGQAPPAEKPKPEPKPRKAAREPSELEQSIANTLADCKTLADCDGVRSLFQRELIDASPEVRAAVELLIDDAKAAIQKRLEADDDFPGDRPPNSVSGSLV
jgi:hypothetical protein